jgi:hypothetical protein
MRKRIFKFLYLKQTRRYFTGQDSPKAVFDKETGHYFSITRQGAVTSEVFFTMALVKWLKDHRKQFITVAKIVKEAIYWYQTLKPLIHSLSRSPNFNREKLSLVLPKT